MVRKNKLNKAVMTVMKELEEPSNFETILTRVSEMTLQSSSNIEDDVCKVLSDGVRSGIISPVADDNNSVSEHESVEKIESKKVNPLTNNKASNTDNTNSDKKENENENENEKNGDSAEQEQERKVTLKKCWKPVIKSFEKLFAKGGRPRTIQNKEITIHISTEFSSENADAEEETKPKRTPKRKHNETNDSVPAKKMRKH